MPAKVPLPASHHPPEEADSVQSPLMLLPETLPESVPVTSVSSAAHVPAKENAKAPELPSSVPDTSKIPGSFASVVRVMLPVISPVPGSLENVALPGSV